MVTVKMRVNPQGKKLFHKLTFLFSALNSPQHDAALHIGVGTCNVKMSMNPFCKIALEEALHIRESALAFDWTFEVKHLFLCSALENQLWILSLKLHHWNRIISIGKYSWNFFTNSLLVSSNWLYGFYNRFHYC